MVYTFSYPEKLLHCDEYVIHEIPKLPSVSVPILVTAQILVLRNLEEKWWVKGNGQIVSWGLFILGHCIVRILYVVIWKATEALT